MINLFKIFVFSIIVMMGFTGFTRFGIPLIIPAPPPVEEKLTGEITMDQYIAIGDKIFNGKGTCTLCHNSLGRAPMLDAVGAIAADRLKDGRYQGKAKTPEEYLHESLVDPSAFVVAGFGKTGTNDTVSPMPDVSKGSIGLSDVEIGAVIAYLQTTAGVEVTVALPTGEQPAAEEGATAAAPAPAATAEEAFGKFGCGNCHMGPKIVDGGDMGPDLSALAASAGSRKPGTSAREFVMESIMDPNAVIADGFEADMMPADLANQMTVSELNLIVNALLGKE